MLRLGTTNLKLNPQGLGCMSISEFYGKPLDDKLGIELIKTAYHAGVNFFDTADCYAFGKNEKLVGKAIEELITQDSAKRSEIILATKCGIIRDELDNTKRGVDNSYQYVINCCEASLNRLGSIVEHIDLYYLHRIANHGAQLDEAMRAMATLLREGKIKAVGLSEANVDMIKTAQAALIKYTAGKHRIAAIQTEYSLLTRNVENNGILDFCKENEITFVAYSPLSRALLTSEINSVNNFEANDFRRSLPRFQGENLAKNNTIVAKVKEVANKKGCLTSQIALAWLLHKGIAIIPGTTKVKNLLSNVAANKIQLTALEFDELCSLESAKGYRYTPEAMKAYGFDDELNA